MTDRELMIEACAGGLTLWGVPRQLGRKIMEQRIPKSGKRLYLKPCPFCGKPGTVEFDELNGKKYLSVGCPDNRCRGAHPMEAVPDEQGPDEVLKWNTRT